MGLPISQGASEKVLSDYEEGDTIDVETNRSSPWSAADAGAAISAC